MKKYNKPEVMLFDCVNEGIAAVIDLDAKQLSMASENSSYVPRVEDFW